MQTVSARAVTLGLNYAHQLRRRSRGHFAGKWQLDEMVVSIEGKTYWIWRVADAALIPKNWRGIGSQVTIFVRGLPSHSCRAPTKTVSPWFTFRLISAHFGKPYLSVIRQNDWLMAIREWMLSRIRPTSWSSSSSILPYLMSSRPSKMRIDWVRPRPLSGSKE